MRMEHLMNRISLLPALMAFAGSVASAAPGVADAPKKVFVEQLAERDSILIADHLKYGIELTGLPFDTGIELPAVKDTLSREMLVVSPWKLDTLKTYRKERRQDLRASMVITAFEEGEYLLPAIPAVVHYPDGKIDTLIFEGEDILVCTMPVDTASFKIHDIKDQMRYPVTFMELLPWMGGAALLAILSVLAVWWFRRRRRLRKEAERQDPAHIVALRKLDAYRGDKYWAPARQKAFYSGVTDALREYIGKRYEISAMEMTTAEMFTALKNSDIPEELKRDLRELFDRADFVKFAKHVADDTENASVLPLGVRFVTSTYQEVIEEESHVL